ncbi:hypothetical protein BDR07DRAFT_1467908 [Suillus spraguei]|nr:hypothetical protein BDR07DRAFT_1467908 [Suillus spraguei]
MTHTGHACVTTAMIAQSKVIERRTQSYHAVCKLIEQYRLSNETVVHTGPSRGTIHNVPSKMTASNKHKNIVLFVQTGAGKSSLVNLMAGENNLERQGGIDLLLFCMRAGRLTDTVQTNYRLFHEFLCDKKVPIVVVITYLENEVGEMDNWWKQNEAIFCEREIHVVGHACIAAIQGNYPERYEESRVTIR